MFRPSQVSFNSTRFLLCSTLLRPGLSGPGIGLYTQLPRDRISSMYTLHHPGTIQCALYTTQARFNVHSTPPGHGSMYTLHHQGTAQCTLYTIHHQGTVQCTLYTTRAQFNIHSTLAPPGHSSIYTLHHQGTVQCTLYTTRARFNVHSTPPGHSSIYTLQHTPPEKADWAREFSQQRAPVDVSSPWIATLWRQ